MSPACINRLCITRDSIEATRWAVFSQEGRPGKRKLAVIISSPPQNQNDDEEKTHCGGEEFKSFAKPRLKSILKSNTDQYIKLNNNFSLYD